ncbi:hypothetical protein BKA67DRAFT_657413 [Truncatella angustata]|uniref:Uncharacterized protein n=1 Tax=Truncatella angustata TaxID=152316 RepID=A0A9P8ZYS6_9PEZI|nr:uncharacterized protein BKA67DRAFT_657413 [Truncatella angustata]KAH6655477.1 hypothetical protein BKA67DRAFT_657413 [Truncatella angustata]
MIFMEASEKELCHQAILGAIISSLRTFDCDPLLAGQQEQQQDYRGSTKALLAALNSIQLLSKAFEGDALSNLVVNYRCHHQKCRQNLRVPDNITEDFHGATVELTEIQKRHLESQAKKSGVDEIVPKFRDHVVGRGRGGGRGHIHEWQRLRR